MRRPVLCDACFIIDVEGVKVQNYDRLHHCCRLSGKSENVSNFIEIVSHSIASSTGFSILPELQIRQPYIAQLFFHSYDICRANACFPFPGDAGSAALACVVRRISGERDGWSSSKMILPLIFSGKWTKNIPKMGTAGAQKGTPKKKSSGPGKKNEPSPRRTDKASPLKLVKKSPILTCYTFADPFPFEAYIYEKADELSDGFMYHMRKYCDGEESYPELDYLNVLETVPRRIPGSFNEIWCNPGTSFWRVVMIRYPLNAEGEGVPSTRDTRVQGLNTLKDFFMNKEYSKWAPDDIILNDRASEDDYEPPALDKFFRDDVIKNFMQKHISEDELNPEFVRKWPHTAAKCFLGDRVSEWARELGFPLAPRVEANIEN